MNVERLGAPTTEGYVQPWLNPMRRKSTNSLLMEKLVSPLILKGLARFEKLAKKRSPFTPG